MCRFFFFCKYLAFVPLDRFQLYLKKRKKRRTPVACVSSKAGSSVPLSIVENVSISGQKASFRNSYMAYATAFKDTKTISRLYVSSFCE